MNKLTYCLTLALFTLWACSGTQHSAIQQQLNDWFPGQFSVLEAGSSASDTTGLVFLQSTSNPDVLFSVAYDPQQEQGGLDKKQVETIIQSAKNNAPAAQKLLRSLQKREIKNAVVGVQLDQQLINVQLYADPFNSVLSARMEQILEIVSQWAKAQSLSAPRLMVQVVLPALWGKRYPQGIMDARFLESKDLWTLKNVIMESNVQLNEPNAAEFLPGNLRLNEDFEAEIRQKVYTDAVDFLKKSKKLDFHVEQYVMVTTVLDVRNLETIKYTFPYCQSSSDTQQNGGCMGKFDGFITSVYTFKTGNIEVDYTEDPRSKLF